MSLDVFQEVFALSLASNLLNDLKGTQTSLQAALRLGLTIDLPIIDPGWQLVWGPVVWKNEPENAETGPDNSWYIAYHPNLPFEDGSVHPTYVIAVAGTPAESTYAWTEQNFAVHSVTDFKAWVAGGIQNRPVIVLAKGVVEGNAYIATGTVNAVHLLLTTPAPEGAVSAGSTLLDFIPNLDHSASLRFISTGHSLGGALSPSLAFTLVLAGYIPCDTTLTYPSAGPSPGNIGFTDFFVQTFPARKSDEAGGYKGWNINLVNTLDVVPQAWSVFRSISPEQNLGNIPAIYRRPVVPIVLGATVIFALRALISVVRYKPLPSQYFTGTPPSAPPTSLAEFLQILGPEHIGSYLKEIGIAIPTLGKAAIFYSELGEKTEAETRYNCPVISDFEWALEHPEEARDAIDKAEGSAAGKAFLSENEW